MAEDDEAWADAKSDLPKQAQKPIEFGKKEFAVKYPPVKPGSRKFVCISGVYKDTKKSHMYLGSLNMELYQNQPVSYVSPVIKATIPIGVRYWRYVRSRIKKTSFDKCALDSASMIPVPYYQKQTPMQIEYMKEILTTYQIDNFYIRWYTMKKSDLQVLLSQNPRKMKYKNFDRMFKNLRIYTFSLDKSKANVCYFLSKTVDITWFNSLWETLKYSAWEGGRTGNLVKNMPNSPEQSKCPKA